MKQQVAVRIRMLDPPPNVAIQVQRGKYELLPPLNASARDLIFEFTIDVEISTGTPNFLGQYAQGPKDSRFVYVNSAAYAGVPNSSGGRRAKLSLMSITREQVEDALSHVGARLETSFAGTAKDGGVTCASVKGLVWKVVKK